MKKLMGSVALETVHYYSEHLFEIKSRHNEMKDQYKVFYLHSFILVQGGTKFI